MSIPLVIKCAAGTKLEPLVYTFADNDGAEISLSGYTAKVTWLKHSTGATGEFDADSVSGGAVTFTVPEAVTSEPDIVDLQVWAGNGTARLDGERWRLGVYDGPGTAPSI